MTSSMFLGRVLWLKHSRRPGTPRRAWKFDRVPETIKESQQIRWAGPRWRYAWPGDLWAPEWLRTRTLVLHIGCQIPAQGL